MQFQADILGTTVERPAVIETTALGAAYLAGLEAGYWKMDELQQSWRKDATFSAEMSSEKREDLYAKWQKAVERSMKWEEE